MLLRLLHNVLLLERGTSRPFGRASTHLRSIPYVSGGRETILSTHLYLLRVINFIVGMFVWLDIKCREACLCNTSESTHDMVMVVLHTMMGSGQWASQGRQWRIVTINTNNIKTPIRRD
jgi:hypothetical protein